MLAHCPFFVGSSILFGGFYEIISHYSFAPAVVCWFWSEECADQYFVELKGGDSDKAVEQLEDTIERLPPRLRGAKRIAFAVFSNTCPKNDTKRQVIKKSLENKGIAIRFCRTGETYQLER